MTWLQRYRIRHYVTNSIWVLPVLSIVAALVLVPLLHSIEDALGWQSAANPDAARAVLGTLASAMFTFIVFVSSALLVAVQLASAQLTPRIIAIVFRDPRTKFALTLFVFTFTFSLAVLVRINETVPTLTARLAAYGCVASLGVFLYLIDHVGKALRPSGALRAVAKLGREVIESVYPRRLTEMREASQEPSGILSGEPTSTVTNLKDGVVLAVDIDGLVSLAQRADCVIEMVPQVADFVAMGDPLFRVFQGGATLTAGACANRSPWVRNAPWSKTRPWRYGLWWTSPRRGFRRPSTTRPPPYWPSTKFITSCGTSAAGTWTTSGCETRQARSGSSTALRLGRILCSWPLRKSAISAARASRSRGVCGPCWRT